MSPPAAEMHFAYSCALASPLGVVRVCDGVVGVEVVPPELPVEAPVAPSRPPSVVRKAFVSSSKDFGLAGALIVCGSLRSARGRANGIVPAGRARAVARWFPGMFEFGVT